MALPQWQSLDQVVGTMAINFVSRLDQANIVPGLEDLKAGSPFLAIFQAVGQSRIRDQQQMMQVLDANDIDSPEADLDRIGGKENIPRFGQAFSRGTVDLSDTSFKKVASKLYHGSPAPIPGTLTLYVTDASEFPSSGRLYIGRGTTNLEGPLNYVATANLGTFWSITLATGTLNFHALTEVVTLAQGGDRTVGAGQVVRTPAGGSAAAVSFATTQNATIPDGEVLLRGVGVVCQTPGKVGNVPKGAIKDVVSPSFIGMAATNPLAIQNGRDTEADEDYRARIKAARASRARGTKTAIETFALGVSSQDENSQVTTATLVKRNLRPTMLTIDDGSGYEERTEGIDYEVLVDSANGGETTFQLTYGRPVAKARAITVLAAPFALVAGCVLAVEVGGVHEEHSFVSGDFRNIGNATAYEVVASINGDASLSYSAQTVNGGTQVALFAKAETNDDISVVAPNVGVNANVYLGFPGGRIDTLRLYKNDRLLQKDGLEAVLLSQAQGSWSAMSSGETLIVDLDGTGFLTYTFTDVDFVNAGTGVSSVSATNSLAAWAKVLNAKLPGITTTISGSFLKLTSNKGKSASASITLSTASTLVIKGMFSPIALSSRGRDFDYVLDRNIGQVELVRALATGDRLTAGTPFTRGYVQSAKLATSVTIPVGGANLWWFVDGEARAVPTGLNGAVYLSPATSAGDPSVTVTARSVITFAPVNNTFSNLRAGDWYIQTVDAAPFGIKGAWRVSEVDASGAWFRVELKWGSYTLGDSSATVFSSVSFVRSTSQPQQVSLVAGTYTLAQLAAAAAPVGAVGSVVASTLRIATDTYDATGNIALMAQDSGAGQLQLPLGLVTNNEPHTAAAESANGEVGTPNFVRGQVTGLVGSTLTASAAVLPSYREGLIDQLLFIRPAVVAPVTARYSTLNGEHYPIQNITSTSVFDVGAPALRVITNADFANQADAVLGVSAYRFGPESYLNVTMNQDPVGGGFVAAMFRRLVADPTVAYGATLRLKDADLLTAGSPSSLSAAFGQTFDFSDFALHMRARGQTHPVDATRSILWRKSTFEGSLSTTSVSYGLPQLPAQAVTVTPVEPDGSLSINLPSGAARAVTLSAGQVVYYVLAQRAVLSGYSISSITRAGSTVTATLTAPFSVTPGTGMTVGMTVWVDISSANFSSGAKTITGTGVNTISWTEAGAATTESPTNAMAAWASNPVDFTPVQVYDCTSGWIDFFGSTGSHVSSISAKDRLGVQLAAAVTGFAEGLTTIGASNAFVFYPISQTKTGVTADLTAATLVTQVNALAGQLVGVVTGTGLGTILQAYPVDAAAAALLQDGVLHIQSSAWNGVDLNYDLTLKFSPLLSGLDYANETFRLVPTTAANVAAFLGRPAVTGLTLGGASLEQANQTTHVQLSSTTLGTLGAVQVTGGTANNLRFSVTNTASVVSGVLKVPCRASAAFATLPTMSWASIATAQVIPKKTSWTAAHSIRLYTSGSRVVVSGGATAWARTTTPISSGRWYIERHGRFAAYTVQGAGGQLAGLGQGDWVSFSGGTASLANLGRYRVVATTGNTLWVDNANAIPEDVTIGRFVSFTYDSVMPGDLFQVGTSAFGAGNQGVWTVAGNDDNVGNDTSTFYLVGTLTDNGPTVMGANVAFLTVTPSTPPTSFGRIRCWARDALDTNTVNLYMDIIDTTRPELVSLPTGAVVQSLDRLEFPTDVVLGQDGYVHDIGLVAAVNQVLYGDESDPDTYPGVISTGDDVFIGPPLIRRVFISVAVREVSGSNTTPGVQAAIASVINSAGGKPVPISKYLTAAQQVSGVLSVVPLDPVPTEGSDTIPVQPGESAKVIDIDNDIEVSIIGS